MTVIGFRGRSCSACTTSPPRQATHGTLCARCWLGASESQRRAARDEQLMTDPLDDLFAMPAVEPERRAS